jgi:major intracellular serine protease
MADNEEENNNDIDEADDDADEQDQQQEKEDENNNVAEEEQYQEDESNGLDEEEGGTTTTTDSNDGLSTPSWSTIQETIIQTVYSTRTEVEAMIDTNPKEWTTKQIVGLSVGTTVLIIISFGLLQCIRRCCCGSGGSERGRRGRGAVAGRSGLGGAPANSTTSNDNRGFQISTHPPHVIRKRVRNYYGSSSGGSGNTKSQRMLYDSSSTTSLPLGALLHGAHKLREKSLTGLGVRVAVIDSGIDKDHPGFHGQVKKQVWFRSGTPLTEDDHGTHVAGTIHFMAPDAELYDYRVFGKSSKYGMDGDRAIARSIVQACEDGCHIINMSLRVSYPIVPAVKEAVEFAKSRGVIMVCAAGNDGDGQAMTNEMFAFPARWDETISVAAVGKKRGIPVANFSESNPQVDFAAIGVDVISFKPLSNNKYRTGSDDLFQSMQGTSMAAPHVTGLIAALMSHGKRYPDSQLRSILAQKYTLDIGAPGRDNSTGLGFVTFLSSRAELDALLSGKKLADGGGGVSSKSTTSSSLSAQKGEGMNDYERLV